MTNEYKLAPIDFMQYIRNTMYNIKEPALGETLEFIAVSEAQYTAMLKDAPALVEVDLDDMKLAMRSHVVGATPESNAKIAGYNQAIEDIKQKHGKLYTTK